jgi:biotin carboxyl carrier protein
MREIKVKVNGKSYDVELGDLYASPVTVKVNGKEFSVEMDSLGSAAPVAAPAAVAVPRVPAAPVPVVSTPAPAPAASSGNDIRSPMPGVILDVVVKAGEAVKAGQVLCSLEAMKMKSAIRSNRDGTIASVDVKDGQRVAFGDVIVRYA